MEPKTISTTDLCFDMMSLLKRFKAITAEIAEKHGLTPIQLGTLHAIDDGYKTMGKVAQTMHCDASNVTGIIDRLTSLNFVIRQDDPRDRRVKSLQLTTQGHAVLEEIIAVMPTRLGCDRLNSSERLSLHQLIVKLTQD
jgi:DNA-binding MarR family transcriptional regulator